MLQPHAMPTYLVQAHAMPMYQQPHAIPTYHTLCLRTTRYAYVSGASTCYAIHVCERVFFESSSSSSLSPALTPHTLRGLNAYDSYYTRLSYELIFRLKQSEYMTSCTLVACDLLLCLMPDLIPYHGIRPKRRRRRSRPQKSTVLAHDWHSLKSMKHINHGTHSLKPIFTTDIIFIYSRHVRYLVET
jgi:hypothetical protein